MGKKLTTLEFLEKVKTANPAMYENCDYSSTEYIKRTIKITARCKIHDNHFSVWPGDHMYGRHGCQPCIDEKRRATMKERYGVDHIFKRSDLIQEAMMKAHGVVNPGLLEDHGEKIAVTNSKLYGDDYAKKRWQKSKQTCLEKYGVQHPMQNPSIAKRAMHTKIKNGGFSNSNSSREATEFIREYVVQKGYSLNQCAFADPEKGLFEWGIYHNGKWTLYDLVVFEEGHRGDKSKIIEILEYHGPFHYTEEDVDHRGNDPAYPWKSNTTTIAESVQRDLDKKSLAKTLTDQYTVIWSPKKHGESK